MLAKSLQSCPTLCDPMDSSPPGFSGKNTSGLPCPPPRDCPNLGIEPMSPVVPALQADYLSLSHWGSPIIGAHKPKQ